ncbi:MAG: hypothetical protein KOO69_01225 [Victivallales bacterium]|nr:hypothetical protein [Victivallales bacterium]
MFRIGTRFILMFAAVLFLTSCASSKRMMRLSPFASKNPKKVSYDESHVNLWPLFYNKGNFNSALWPLVDNDAKGFAVRPLYNQDGNEYSVLFPLCAWNPVNGDGWAFNTYWEKNYFGSFPLFHLGDKKKFNYILPVWWDNDWESFGTLGMLFSPKMNFVGPLWFEKGESLEGGIFPVFFQESKQGYLFPLYNYEKCGNEFYLNFMLGALGRFAYAPDESHYRLLNGFYVNENENNYQGFIPLYYYEQEENQKLLITPLGGRGWNTKTGENSLVNILGPLYIKTQNKKQKTQFEAFCWPLYFHSKSQYETNLGSFPLFWYRSDSFLNILGPLFHKTDDSYSILLDLFFYSNSSSKTKYGSFPLFWYEKSKKNGVFNILGLLWDYRWNRRDWAVKTLLPLLWFEKNYNNKHILPGTPRFPYRISLKRRKPRTRILKEKFVFNYLLFWESSKKKYTVWKTEFNQEKLNEISNNLQKLNWLNRNVKRYKRRLKKEKKYIGRAQKRLQKEIEKRQKNIQKLAVLLRTFNIPVLDLTDAENIKKTTSMMFEKYCTTAKSEHISIPFLYTYDEFRGDSKWNILWFLANGKKQKKYEKISILRYLYRYEKSGDVSSRIIFPFMTYKTAPEKSKFSFLWRVFSYKRENKKVSGHIFFIPF